MASLLLFLSTFLLIFFLSPSSPARVPAAGFRAHLTRVDSSISPLDGIALSLRRDRARLHRLSPSLGPHSASFESPISSAPGEYHLHLSIGSPPVPLTALIDTGSDLIWTRCRTSDDPYFVTSATFLPKKSSSFSNISSSSPFCEALNGQKYNYSSPSCSYSYVYGDNSYSEGFLGSDIFRFGDGSVPTRVRFGCGLKNEGNGMTSNEGVVGFGRGQLSLASQLDVKRFAYCLSDKNSTLLVGSAVGECRRSTSTRILPNTAYPSYYYVGLEGISIDGRRMPIPEGVFRMTEGGDGGVIIDSATSVSMLTEEAYDVVRSGVVDAVGREVSRKEDFGGLDLCYDIPEEGIPNIPGMVFHFTGMDLRLPGENFMVVDTEKKLVCLAMAPAGPLSVIGNWQQQNVLVVYDIMKNTVSMVPRPCGTV